MITKAANWLWQLLLLFSKARFFGSNRIYWFHNALKSQHSSFINIFYAKITPQPTYTSTCHDIFALYFKIACQIDRKIIVATILIVFCVSLKAAFQRFKIW